MATRVFYDGTCGLCHRTVRFLLKHDPDGRLFRYAPLDGPTFAAQVDAATRAVLADSVVVVPPDGRLLQRSEGVLYLGRELGGVWKLLAVVAGVLPRSLRDWAYDRVAAVRHRLFARPDEACPVVPQGLRDRFDP